MATGVKDEKFAKHNNFKAIFNELKELMANSDFTTIGVIVALAVVAFTILVLIVVKKRSSLRRSVLLIGLCDSGKTLLFSQLVHRKSAGTHTSIKENVGDYQTSNGRKYLRLVDLPGHERVRQRFIDQFKVSARGIIFLIDSMAFQSQLKDVAECLYNLLSDKSVCSICPAILIACNKQDVSLAKSSKLIKNQLEKEMYINLMNNGNTLRVTKSAMLDSTDSTGTRTFFLGKAGKDFEFQHIIQLSIDFAECSALGDGKEPQLSSIQEWLTKIA